MDFKKEKVICRLCLKKLTENCELIEEVVQYTLNFLSLCPNLAVSDDPMICETCAVNLKKCFDFKTRCLSTEDCIASFAEGEDKKGDLRNIYSKVKLDGNIDRVPNDHSVCRFCLELVKDNASMSVRHDVDLVAVLQKYFLEMDLRITDDIIACTPCFDSLQFHLSFVNNYLTIEEKINEYCKVGGANYKEQVDLRDVAAFKSKRLSNAKHISNLIIKEDKHENIPNTNVVVEVKFEDSTDVKVEKEELVNEEIQQRNCNSSQHHPTPSQSDCILQLTGAKPAKYTCEICGYQNNHKNHLQEHILAHKGIVQEYNCEISPFKTKTKDASEVTMYRCAMCSFQAKQKHHLIDHMITHKDDSEVTMYKCHQCKYETKYKSNLKSHMLTHKTPSEITMYKCDLCDYETKWKCGLKQHMPTHEAPSEVTMYKCHQCDYEVKRKSTLRMHILTHKPHSKIAMYKCALCDYESKRKFGLQKHMLIHKAPSEITMYKCHQCKYETKRKSDLKKHLLTHKPQSEITMYECHQCNYEAKWKSAMHKHMLTHKTPSEITMYECDLCHYKGKQKSHLKRHMLIHKSPSEITMYKCHQCRYEAKWKSDLKTHILTHKRHSEIAMYKCDLCDHETKWKFSLKRHLLVHK